MNAKAAAAAGGAVNDASFAADMRPALVQYFRRRCGNAEEAEDLAQDVLLSMVGRPQWESPEHASGCVFREAAVWTGSSARPCMTLRWSRNRKPHTGCMRKSLPSAYSARSSSWIPWPRRWMPCRSGRALVRLEHMRQLCADTPSGYWPAEAELLRMDSRCTATPDGTRRD